MRDILNDGWDLMIAHPPCTYLCSSGLHWNKRRPGREKQTQEALGFVRTLLEANISRIALENPVGKIGSAIRKADQKIQPWQFGHDASKGTCLWLKNLPLLHPTGIVSPCGWEQVVYASECMLCPCCEEEPYCELHEMHYGECSCIGPTQDDATYITIDGYQFASLEVNSPLTPVSGVLTPRRTLVFWHDGFIVLVCSFFS